MRMPVKEDAVFVVLHQTFKHIALSTAPNIMSINTISVAASIVRTDMLEYKTAFISVHFQHLIKLL